MERFTVEIATGNDAFVADGAHMELKTIFDSIIEKVRAGHIDGAIFDSNGNRVGRWSFD